MFCPLRAIWKEKVLCAGSVYELKDFRRLPCCPKHFSGSSGGLDTLSGSRRVIAYGSAPWLIGGRSPDGLQLYIIVGRRDHSFITAAPARRWRPEHSHISAIPVRSPNSRARDSGIQSDNRPPLKPSFPTSVKPRTSLSKTPVN